MTQDEQRKTLAPIPSDADFAASPDTVREYIAQLEYEIAALSSPVAQAENTTGLCVKILDTRPNKPFGTWQVIEVLEAIKGFGLIIVEKKDV